MISQLESFYNDFLTELPNIKTEFAKVPNSILSLEQFKTWWEALFVAVGYTVASAVLATVLKFTLGFVAISAFSIGILSLVAAAYRILSNQNQTEELTKTENQEKPLLGIGCVGIAIACIIWLVPAFLTLGMIGLAVFRSQDLIWNAMPEKYIGFFKNAEVTCLDMGNRAYASLTSLWATNQSKASKEEEQNPSAQTTSHN